MAIFVIIPCQVNSRGVKAYKLFDEGKSPLEVTAELNIPGPQAQRF
jgi:hypothetical protein